jgi:hypothetical protein
MNSRKKIGRSFRRLQIMPSLQINPKLSRNTEIFSETQRGIRRPARPSFEVPDWRFKASIFTRPS